MSGELPKQPMGLVEILHGKSRALKVKDVATLLSVSERQVYKLAAENRIPSCFRIGGSIRFDPVAVAAWLHQRMAPVSVELPQEESRGDRPLLARHLAPRGESPNIRARPDGRKKKMMVDPEINDMKSRIDLRAYAASLGYTLEKRESWRGSAVMRHPNGDKIIIKRNEADGHFVYFSVRDDGDNGSIIDFAGRRLRLNLGAIRKELRPWVGGSPVKVPVFPPLRPVSRDRMRVEREYAKMRDARRHPYLENERALPASLLELPRFVGCIRIDSRGNACFPHRDLDGISGFEIRNTNYKGFSSGGTKSIWMSNPFPDDDRIVLCESAIDALSYAMLFPDDHTRYGSIGGKPNPVQPELVRSSVARMPPKSKIVAAMDADETGGELAEMVRQAVLLSGRDDLAFVFQEPAGAKDWNDVLRAKRQHIVPNRPLEIMPG
jgi:excisionase family DNA binding protein